MSESFKEMQARWDREKQTKAMQEQAEAAKKQTYIMERQFSMQKQALRKEKQMTNRLNGKESFHGLYCLAIGWWLSLVIVCFIIPLFFPGGRSLIKKAFGIW